MEEFEDRLFINGQYVPSVSGKKFKVYNPFTEELTAEVYEADERDVDLAVDAAEAAFEGWWRIGAFERAEYLYKLADLVDAKNDDMAKIEAVCMGKPVSKYGECKRAAMIIRYYAGLASDIHGETSLSTPGYVNMTLRQPYGVCGAIVPWNAPIVMMCFKLGPALAAGNTMVIKSSEKAPLTSIEFGKLVKEAGIPDGVVNILNGYGQPCGEAIARHMRIRKISFTGSTKTGRAIKVCAANSNLKKVSLELGGKGPMIVFDDADLEKAARDAAISIILNTGQSCSATSRVYIHSSIAEKFKHLYVQHITEIGKNQPGMVNPLLPETNRGPQADKTQFDYIMRFLKESKELGHQILTGGGREGSQGYFIEPTVIFEPGDDSRVMREEIFGPVACLSTFVNEDEVIKRANDSEYGLYSAVYTRDVQRALRFIQKLDAGSCGLNCTSPTIPLDLPFGGYKSSGDGRDLGRHGLDQWTEVKSVLMEC